MLVRVRILGPVGIWRDGVEVAVPSGRPRAILAMLAMQAGRSVSADQLITGLWGEDAPITAAKTLQVHVSTLRSRLRDAEVALVFSAAGYRLDIDPKQVDVACFESLTEQGFAALAQERNDVASRSLQEALDEWSGDPLSNVMDAAFASHEAERLALRRLAVRQARLDADLSLGLGVTLVDEARAIAEANPYDERACGQLMVALYRAGQPAAALRAFGAAREALGEELGLDVGPELVELERQVLMHDDRLLVQPPSTSARANNLPQELSRFIGRQTEADVLRTSIYRSRLTTVAGAGGAGKTRIALHVAGSLLDDYSDGVLLVELAPLTTAETVAAAVAAVVGSGPDEGTPGMANAIGTRSMLLVLDNCEHVVDAVAALAHGLLRQCPNLRILTTSREPLAIDGEQVYRLPPLGLVPVENTDIEAIRTCDAVRLLADRAALQRSEFMIDEHNASAAARICARLDGMPLAIELAAARLRTLTIDELARRLDERFDVLTASGRQVLARQQTLRALIDWSYQLLADPEQRMLDRLSVFVGGFTIDGAEAICSTEADMDALELVTALVDKSLVEVSERTSGRFRLLETIREYAAEHLADRQGSISRAVRVAHARHFLALAEKAAPSLEQGPGQLDWLARLTVELDNLRAAAITFSEHPDGSEEGLRLVNALNLYWDRRALYLEGAATTTALLAHASAVEQSEQYVLALCTGADMLERVGDLERARELADEAARLALLVGSIDLEIHAALRTSLLAARRGDLQTARDLLSSYDAPDRVGFLAIRLPMVRAYVCLYLEEYANARVELDKAAKAARASGNERRLAAILSNISVIDVIDGDLESATFHLQDAQTLAARMGDHTTLLYANINLGLVAIQAGDHTRARIRYREALLLNMSGGDLIAIQGLLLGLALCSTASGELSDSAVLHGVVDEAYQLAQTILDPTEAALMHEDRERLRDRLGEAELARGMDRGRRFNVVEAIEFARRLRDHSLDNARPD
ncbi:MAG: BTAD domain-containing putative transcriptional regulator [Ilumatobacteraceae bacterium]